MCLTLAALIIQKCKIQFLASSLYLWRAARARTEQRLERKKLDFVPPTHPHPASPSPATGLDTGLSALPSSSRWTVTEPWSRLRARACRLIRPNTAVPCLMGAKRWGSSPRKRGFFFFCFVFSPTTSALSNPSSTHLVNMARQLSAPR